MRLIVDREREIRAFVPEESWRIVGVFTPEVMKADSLRDSWEKFLHAGKADGRTGKERNTWLSKQGSLGAELVKFGGSDAVAGSVAAARSFAESLGFVVEGIDEAPFGAYADKGFKSITLRGRIDPRRRRKFRVSDVQTKRTLSKPNPPFTTAAMQQASSTALGFAPSRTMRIAQQLYEGIDLGGGEGQVGLITYMRTDSTNLSRESVEAARGSFTSNSGSVTSPRPPTSTKAQAPGRRTRRSDHRKRAEPPSRSRAS